MEDQIDIGNRVAVRPATATDLPDLARLMVDLYQAELPGALTGPRAGREELLAYTLQANGAVAFRNRFVVCAGERVLGTGMIQFPDEPVYERAPRGTLMTAFRAIGVGPSLRLLLTVARSLVTIYRDRDRNSGLIHSVVVSADARGKGVGRLLMAALEAQIRDHGLPRACLQVLASNTAAQRLYYRLGYRVIWQTTGWQTTVGWPSLVMAKELV